MLVLTQKEKRVFVLLLFCFLTGVLLYWIQEKEIVIGREISRPSQIDGKIDNASKNSEKVNINEATASELEKIPGIGPGLAKNILEYRKENRRFFQLNQLLEVKGIGEKKFEKIKNLIVIR